MSKSPIHDLMERKGYELTNEVRGRYLYAAAWSKGVNRVVLTAAAEGGSVEVGDTCLSWRGGLFTGAGVIELAMLREARRKEVSK